MSSNELKNERQRLYYQANKEKLAKAKKIYNSTNKDHRNTYKRNYNKKRFYSDDLFRLKCNIRSLFGKTFSDNGFTKNSKTSQLLGCTYDELKTYLENKFESWMTWENRGKYNGEFNYGWDIDHIIPTSKATCNDDLIKLNHYTNLQPLCSKINRDIKRNN